jgi:hypothetical protein
MLLSRFRLRTLLLAVAMIAIVLGVGAAQRRRALYQQQAAYHAAQEARFVAISRSAARQTALLRRVRSATDSALAFNVWQAERARQRAQYHSRIRRKYEDAASHPWILVTPDPQPPE